MQELLNFIEYIEGFNGWTTALRLFLAVVLGGLVGIERSNNGHAAGLRTHILVCLGAAIASMTGLHIHAQYASTGDVSRIAAQVVSGIGFLGAGTILVKHKSTIIGLTTSACVWVVGTIGIAVGFGFYEAAILGALLVLFISKTLSTIDKNVRKNMKEISIYAEITNAKQLNAALTEIRKLVPYISTIHLTQTKTNISGGVGADLTICIGKEQDADALMNDINEIENIYFAIIVT